MKKLLAILCTVAILFGSVFTGIVVSANTATVKYYNASSLQGYTLGSYNSGELSKPLSAAHTGSYVFTVNAVIPEGQLGRLRLADSGNNGYGYLLQDNWVGFRYNGGGSAIGQDLTVEGLKINNNTFKLQIKATVMDINEDGTNDTRFQLYINDQLIRTDDITSYTPTVTQVTFRNIGFTNPDPTLSTDAAKQYTADDIDGYTMGTSNTSDLYKPFNASTTGSYVFTAKATVGAGTLARFRLADSGNNGYGYLLQDNWVGFRYNGGGSAIGKDLTVEGLKINNNTFKLQIKATVMDIEGDGFDDTRMELYIDDVLVRTDDVKDYTPTVTQVIFREIAFDKLDPVFSTDPANQYNADSIGSYTQGTISSSDTAASLASPADGSYVFTAKATVGSGLARFRIANSQDLGYGYFLEDNKVYMRQNGGGAAIGTDLTVDGLKINNNTFKLQIKATVADFDGDGLDDTRMELYIDDVLVRTDDIKDFTPVAARIIFREIGFEKLDPVFSTDAANKYNADSIGSYTQGTISSSDIAASLASPADGNYVFTAKATVGSGLARFRIANASDSGYGYFLEDNKVYMRQNGGGAAIGTDLTVEGLKINNNTFKLQIKATVADFDGDGLDDTRMELYIDDVLVRTDDIKDFTPVAARIIFREIGFEKLDPVFSTDAPNYYSASSIGSYTQGTITSSDTAASLASPAEGSYVFTANATVGANLARFRIANASDSGYGYFLEDNKVYMRQNGGGAAIGKDLTVEGLKINNNTFKLQIKATIADFDDDGLDDTRMELYIDNVLVRTDDIKDFTPVAARIIFREIGFEDYAPEVKDRTEIDAGTLVAPGQGLTNSDLMVSLGKNINAECISFKAIVKTGTSGVKFRFADSDWEGYGYTFDKNTVTFQKNGGGDAIATSAASTKGTYLGTIFKMQVDVTAVDTNYDDVNDATNFKLYIDGDLILDNTVQGYNSSAATFVCVSKIAFYKENVLTGGASVSSSIIDEDDTKISFSHLGLPTGKHYEGDGKGHASAAYEGSILNTVFEGKVMLENGGFLRYPAHKTGWHGIELKLEGTSLLIKEVGFDANGNGATNDTLATITSADIGGAVIPATTFDYVVHVNTSCDADGEIWDDNNDEPVDYVDNVVEITYYINGYKVYSFKTKGFVDYEIDEDGNVVEGSYTMSGGPALYDNFVLIHGLKGEFTDSNSVDGVKVKTPADYLGNMHYGKYESNATNGAWTLGLNEGFTTDLIIEEGTPVGDIIQNTIGSLKTYADGSLRFQVYIDGSNETYRLTNAVADGGKNYVGTQFNYKLTVQDVDHDGGGLPNDLAIGVFIDGKLCNNEYIYVDNVVRMMSGQNFSIIKGVELIAPTIETADDGYVVITPEDFGIDLGKYTNTSGASTYFFNSVELNHASKSINGKRFETKIKFIGANGQNSYIAFGNTSSTRLVIYPNSENNVIIRTFLGGTNNGTAATIPNLTANKVHDLALTFDYVNGNLKVGVYVDGEWVLDFWANGIGESAYLLSKFGAFSATKDLGVQFGEDAVPVVCNIDEGVYFIEYIEGATYILDGEEIEVTEEGYELWLDEPHAYTLEIVKGTYSVTKMIVAYYENDLNGDSAVNVLDFIAMMKNTMADEFTDYVAMAAAGKTSLTDVCKPKDLILMKKVLLGIA